MAKAYAIKNWKLHYERNHKDTEVVFRWVGMPTKHDGKSYRRLARHPDAIPVFLAFFLMVQVAAKMPVRGLLADEAGPLDADDIADETGFPADIFDKAFNVLIDKKIDWIELLEVPTSPDAVGTSSPTGQDSTGQDSTHTEGDGAEPDVAAKRRSPKGDAVDPPGFVTWWEEYPYLKKFPNRKKGRAKCKRIWLRDELEAVAEQVIACLRRCKVSHEWAREDGRFVQNCEAWLNDTPWQTIPVDTTKDPKATAEQAASESRCKAERSDAEKRRAEEERQSRIDTLTQLPPARLAELKKQCVKEAEPTMRAKMEAADPLSGQMLSVLICGKLKALQLAGVA